MRYQIPTIALGITLLGASSSGALDFSATSLAANPFPTARVSAIIAKNLSAQQVPGAAVAIVQNGIIVYSKGFGIRDMQGHAIIDADTRFEIGSVTKQFTAAAILQLKEHGKLSLDDPLAKYVPGFPHAREIILRELLNQTSGLANYTNVRGFTQIEQQPGNFQKVAALIANDELHFKPGTRWEYSNTNYIALGRVIEVASGKPYNQYIREHLFAPAGMEHSATIADEPKIGDVARGYWLGQSRKSLVPVPPSGSSWAQSAGDIISTADDMAKWDIALKAGKIITPEDFAQMTTSAILADGQPAQYGFGWFLDSEDDRQRFWHNGITHGFSSINVMFPNDDLDIIVLENVNSDWAVQSPVMMAFALYETVYPKIAIAAHATASGEDPAVTLRAKRLITEIMGGTSPSSEFTPSFAKQFAQMFEPERAFLKQLGVPQNIVFKQRIENPTSTAYVYRVEFSLLPMSFIIVLDKKTNLIDNESFNYRS